jgi:hypothetical protein
MPRPKIERRRALEVCRLNKIKPGDVINSVAWVAPRMVRSVDSAGVVVAEMRENGTIKADVPLSSLPVDAQPFDHPSRRR